MPKAIADPDELRKFASHLKAFNNQVSQSISVLHGEFRGLGDTWQDQEYARFAPEFEQTVQILAKFIRVSEEHIPFMLRKAQKIDDYLNSR